MVYAFPGAGALDYFACHYGTSRLLFRGPQRPTDGDFIACLGGTETYGKYIPLPFATLLRPDGTLKRKDDLLRVFAEAGIDLKRPVIATCGSGVSACLPLLALAAIGHRDGALYDGSWAEWGSRADAPVATGP